MAMLAVLVAVIAVLAVLYFTTYRPKDPRVEVPTVQLLSLYTAGYPASVTSVNLTLILQISIHNPNKAPFYMQDGSTASLIYYDSTVGSARLPPGTILDQSSAILSAALSIGGPSPLLTGPQLVADVASGILHTSISVTILGKVTTLSIFSHHSKVLCICDISISLAIRGIESYACQRSNSINS